MLVSHFPFTTKIEMLGSSLQSQMCTLLLPSPIGNQIFSLSWDFSEVLRKYIRQAPTPKRTSRFALALNLKKRKQESIPVGCVPPAS